MRNLSILFLLISNLCLAQSTFVGSNKVASSWDADYQNVLAAAQARGIYVDAIPYAMKTAQNQFMIDTKAAIGISSFASSTIDFDNFFLYKAKVPKAFTEINWSNPAKNQTVSRNNPLYIPFTGFANGNSIGGGSEILNIGKVGPNLTINSGEFMAYYSDMVAGSYTDGGSSTGTNNLSFNVTRTSTTVSLAWGENAGTTLTTGSQSDDLYFCGRTSISSKFVRKGSGSRITGSTSTTALWPYDFYLLGSNNGSNSITGSLGGDKKIGLFASGRLLTTTEETAINTAFNTYLTSLAAIPAYTTIGSIYSGSSYSTLNDFTTNGATVSASGGLLQFTGGANTYTQTLDLTSIGGVSIGATKLSKWSQTITFDVPTIGASANWGGVGLRSSNANANYYDLVITMDFTTTNKGKMKMFNGPTHAQLGVTSSALSITAGDRISMTFTLDGANVTYSAYNVTTDPTATTKITGFANAFGTLNGFITNTGHFAIFNGGNFNVASWTITSNEYKGAKVAIIGDSKSQGYRVADSSPSISNPYSLNNAYFYKLQDYIGPMVNIAGSSDRTADYITRTYEIINWIQPETVVIAGVCNDIRAGVPSAIWQANVLSLISTFQAAGIRVIFWTGFKETVGVGGGIDQTAVSTWAAANLSGVCEYWDSLPNNYTLSDGVHENYTGHDQIFRDALSFGKLNK